MRLRELSQGLQPPHESQRYPVVSSSPCCELPTGKICPQARRHFDICSEKRKSSSPFILTLHLPSRLSPQASTSCPFSFLHSHHITPSGSVFSFLDDSPSFLMSLLAFQAILPNHHLYYSQTGKAQNLPCLFVVWRIQSKL